MLLKHFDSMCNLYFFFFLTQGYDNYIYIYKGCMASLHNSGCILKAEFWPLSYGAIFQHLDDGAAGMPAVSSSPLASSC